MLRAYGGRGARQRLGGRERAGPGFGVIARDHGHGGMRRGGRSRWHHQPSRGLGVTAGEVGHRRSGHRHGGLAQGDDMDRCAGDGREVLESAPEGGTRVNRLCGNAVELGQEPVSRGRGTESTGEGLRAPAL